LKRGLTRMIDKLAKSLKLMKNRGSSFVIFLSWSDPNNAIFTNATTEKF